MGWLYCLSYAYRGPHAGEAAGGVQGIAVCLFRGVGLPVQDCSDRLITPKQKNTPEPRNRLHYTDIKETAQSQGVPATSLEPAPLGNSSPEGSAVISVAKIV